MRTRGTGEVCQAPRENQQQRPESRRNEKGGTQQTMPVSVSTSIRPARAIPFERKMSVVICRSFTCSMKGKRGYHRFIPKNFVTALFLLPFSLLLSFGAARKMPGCFSFRSHFVSILRTCGNAFAEFSSANFNRVNCDVRKERDKEMYL